MNIWQGTEYLSKYQLVVVVKIFLFPVLMFPIALDLFLFCFVFSSSKVVNPTFVFCIPIFVLLKNVL